MQFAQAGPLQRITSAGSAPAHFAREFWPIWVPLVLGFAAIYLLLPRARRYPPLWGGLLGGVAIVFAGCTLIRTESRLGETILFYSFSGIAIVAGALLVVQRNPARAALSFALVVLATCGLFLLQAAPFLMAATAIVYAGAIIVTFLFVIMLAQQAGVSNADARSREPLLATIAGFVLLGSLLCVLHRNYDIQPLSVLEPLDEYFAKADRASRATSTAEIQSTLADTAAFFNDFLRQVEEIGAKSTLARNAMEELSTRERLLDAQQQVVSDRVRIEQKQARLRDISRIGAQIRYSFGSLQYNAGNIQASGINHPLSGYSGLRPNLPVSEVPLGDDGKPAMPAANVASLGKSLFTDYVLGVELAGTLLLVATIGALAIAGRRPEGLR